MAQQKLLFSGARNERRSLATQRQALRYGQLVAAGKIEAAAQT